MKEYIVTVRAVDSKVQLIKVLREFSKIGLKEAKDKVEAKRGFSSECYSERELDFEVLVNEQQLGRAYARYYLGRNKLLITDIKEVTRAEWIDLTT